MSIHEGHRQRLRKRFRQEGLDGFEEVQILELLLFYCIPRVDTNPIAHGLIDRFGSLAQVMEAPVSELKKVEGMGEASAEFLSLVHAFGRSYQVSRDANQKVLNTIEACGRHLLPFFQRRRNETVYILCLDAKCKVLCCKEVGEGSVNSAAVPIRRIVEMALNANATSVVLAHNHPSGLAIPSDEDKLTTVRVARALDAVEIQLVDHLIIAEEEFVSLAQSGMYCAKDCKVLL